MRFKALILVFAFLGLILFGVWTFRQIVAYGIRAVESCRTECNQTLALCHAECQQATDADATQNTLCEAKLREQQLAINSMRSNCPQGTPQPGILPAVPLTALDR